MSLDIADLGKSILGAFKDILKDSWSDTREYAKGESKKMALALAQIAKLRALGQISEDEAYLLLEMQKNSTRAVLLTIEGIGLITAQRAIDAALKAVADAVNGTIGFALI